MKTQSFLLTILFVLIFNTLHAQPYYDTHVENPYVKQNIFRQLTPNFSQPPAFAESKEKLPIPYWPARPDVLNCYWHTWELAFSNLKSITPESSFVSPYIDPAFNGHIFMWDCSFMTMFGKYGSRAFPFQGTLDNFYARQHKDGFICREIVEKDGSDFFERFDVASTGPDILPWAEWEYFLNFNDTARLAKVFPPLMAFYQWYQANRTWTDGTYFSSGWGCGMDNQPRLPEGINRAWAHGHMTWIDISLQEVFAGETLIAMAKKLNRENDVKDIKSSVEKLKNTINSLLWDEQQGFYFDRFREGNLSTVKSIAAYWALISGVATTERADKLIKHLENPAEFARVHRVPSLSADNPFYDPNGGYWLGSIWAPTNYMVLRGLTKYGYDSLAYQIAVNHLNNVVEVFTKTGGIRENYAPDKVQGNDRNNFVGWTGLAPISVLFEYVFGFRPDVPNNTLIIDTRLIDEYGIRQYPFGKNGMLDIIVKKRKTETEKPSLFVQSNIPLTIVLKWKDDKMVKEIKVGKNIL